jgi:hypothetical protein
MIKLNPLYTYKPGVRSEQNGIRHYVSEQGDMVPSVTTILSSTKDSASLDAWKKRVGEKNAQRIAQESTSLGTMMHTHLENYVRGEPRPGGSNMGRVMAKNMADVIIEKGLCKVDEVWGIEAHLMFDNLWAGTTDLVGVAQGQPCIMDFKTTNKPKPREWVEDYFLQLTSYSLCHNKTFGTNINRGLIFMVSRDLVYQEFELTPEMFEEYHLKWLLRVEEYYNQ